MTLVAYTKIRSNVDAETLLARVENSFPRLENREYFNSIKSRKNQDSISESLCALLVLAELIKRAEFDPGNLILSRQDSGKPHFLNSQIKFSLSHSHKYAAAAICDTSLVGIDIETSEISHEKAEKLAQRFFSADEIKEFQAAPESFLKIWTKKEAYAKMSDIPLSDLIANERKCPSETRKNAFFEIFKINDIPLTVCRENPCEIKYLGEISI